ncbi:MAG: hypothetical protein QGI21_03700 [Candidatus Poseidoniaceae archaeon]|jgi:hypothetical protein|nr:hypothetical protein [Candidatus Poseidoniaceae archaeon]
MKWLAAAFFLLVMIPSSSAIGDLSIYAEASHKSSDSAPVLVEHFHGNGDSEHLENLQYLDRTGKISLVNWWTNPDENSNWPSSDANSRAMFHSVEEYPTNVIDNNIVETITPREIENDIAIDWNIQLIGSSEVELLNITATWTNPANLQMLTQIHIFIVERNAVDSVGRTAPNLLRDWAPSSSFLFSNNSTNNWNSTITREHLTGAGIDLGDASHADDFELFIVMIGAFEGEDGVRTLSLQRGYFPTSWQSSDASDSLTPALLLCGLIVIIGFVVNAEYTREKGLPRLEGNWSKDGNIEYRIITGKALEIGDLNLNEGWKSNSGLKRERVSSNHTKSGVIKVTGSGELKLRLSVKVDDLGDWILDLNLPEFSSND